MNKSGGGSTSPQRAFGVICHGQCVSEPVSLRLIRSLVERQSLPPLHSCFPFWLLLRNQMLNPPLQLLSKLGRCSVWSAWGRLSCRECGKIVWQASFPLLRPPRVCWVGQGEQCWGILHKHGLILSDSPSLLGMDRIGVPRSVLGSLCPLKENEKQSLVEHPLIPELGRQRQRNLCEFEASLVCLASSRSARAMQVRLPPPHTHTQMINDIALLFIIETQSHHNLGMQAEGRVHPLIKDCTLWLPDPSNILFHRWGVCVCFFHFCVLPCRMTVFLSWCDNLHLRERSWIYLSVRKRHCNNVAWGIALINCHFGYQNVLIKVFWLNSKIMWCM